VVGPGVLDDPGLDPGEEEGRDPGTGDGRDGVVGRFRRPGRGAMDVRDLDDLVMGLAAEPRPR